MERKAEFRKERYRCNRANMIRATTTMAVQLALKRHRRRLHLPEDELTMEQTP